MHTLEPRLEQARQDNRRFKGLLQEKRRTEAIRDSLLAQISVIRTVDGNRYVWPHIMDEVTRALPAYTWLTQVDVLNTPAPTDTTGSDSLVNAPINFEIQGRTVAIESYTRFLRQLEASPWLSDVTPMQAQTVVEQDRPVTAFTIRATFQRADSAYIRTVPFSKSVR
jgi:Tfp pilus assembly protein PilN